MPQAPTPGDIIVYVYKESNSLPRGDRLSACAAAYAAGRGLPGGSFVLEREPGHKPFFPGQPHIHFSISHSGEYWLAAFHGAPLGLDIQRHTPRAYAAIARRWYHADEYAAVLQYGKACFFDIWSAKESFCKANGQGINAAFAHFCVAGQSGALLACCQGWQLRPLALFGGYSACLCAEQIGKVYIIRP